MDSLRILFVEDDADDLILLEQVLDEKQGSFETKAIKYGDKVLQYLEECVSLPHVIVLDLNLPMMNGREVLQRIKSSSRLTEIPVVVLTTSSSKEDIDFCYREGAHKFYTKPATIEGLNSIMSEIVSIGLKKTSKT